MNFAWIALVLSSVAIIINVITLASDFHSKRELTLSKAGGQKCESLTKSDGKNICTNIFFKRNLKNGICPRDKCKGFNCGESNDVSLNGFLKITATNFLPEIVAFLLALNEIVGG